MSGIIRDFSQEAIMNIKEIIKENVDEEDQFALWDWVDDTFKLDDLDIKDYLDNVSKYQAHMVDKHNINSKKFDDILDRVYTVDVNYGKRFMEIAGSLEAFNKKILDISNMISPEGITLDSETYEGVIKGIGKKYDSNISLKYKLEDIDKEMPELRDVPWYEKALNAVGGAGVAIVEDNLETGVNLLGGTIDFLCGTKYRENGLRNLEATNQWIVDNLVTYEEGYYFGKTVGNAICVAEGIVLAVGGVTTLISAAPFTLIGGGLTLTGIGSVIGGPILAVSTTAVAAGTLATTGGFGMVYSSYNNGKENAARVKEVKKPEIDKGKLKKDAKKLDEKIGKIDKEVQNPNSRIYDSTKPMSPSNYPNPDPDFTEPPVRYEPKTIEEVVRMRRGKGPTTKATHGDRNIEAHHRGQKSVETGGIIDDLEEYTHRRGGNHTRHTKPSELTPAQRAKEIREYWKKRGSEYILPGEGI